MGFGNLLRTWRKAAGVNQDPVARVLGMAIRTYGNIERGAAPARFSREQCDALAGLLRLDTEAHHALLLHNVGTTFDVSHPEKRPPLDEAMRQLIEEQPSPSLLCDRHWHVLAYNNIMAQWWPWVTKPGANLLKWGLLDPEARVQHHQWRDHANRLIRLMKFALAGRRDDPELARLAEEVRTDPDVLSLWETTSEVAENRDGQLHRMRVPTLGWKTVELISHTLHPASLPDSRLIIFTTLQETEHSELPARPRGPVNLPRTDRPASPRLDQAAEATCPVG
ncbi:helix-turn-helix domain-containing protein [Streptomyces niveus]|uniref:helix-turn-helix domain-containing protein n=1 Tax=Streptomyces niveus TaxID=193462 RepID=UPI00368BCB52